jgi:hypothetical protein
MLARDPRLSDLRFLFRVALSNPKACSPGQSLTRSATFPTLVKYLARNIGNHMAHWKVIETVSGNIEAISGSVAHDRPGRHERTVWEGEAADKAEALQNAEKADPRVDLEWMRIRYERDLDVR